MILLPITAHIFMCLSQFSFFPVQFDETVDSKQREQIFRRPEAKFELWKKKIIMGN